MPTIAVLDGGITISIYYNDHRPPHFHAKQGGDEILVVIASLTVFAGSAPAAMTRRVLDWAAAHQPELPLCWARAQSGQPPGRIP